MVNNDRPFAKCQTLKDAGRQAIIKQNKDTDLSRVYKCMKSLDIPSCLVFEEHLKFLLTVPPTTFIRLLEETDRKKLTDVSLPKRKSDETDFEGVQSKQT